MKTPACSRLFTLYQWRSPRFQFYCALDIFVDGQQSQGCPDQNFKRWQAVGAVAVDGRIRVVAYDGNPTPNTVTTAKVVAIVR